MYSRYWPDTEARSSRSAITPIQRPPSSKHPLIDAQSTPRAHPERTVSFSEAARLPSVLANSSPSASTFLDPKTPRPPSLRNLESPTPNSTGGACRPNRSLSRLGYSTSPRPMTQIPRLRQVSSANERLSPLESRPRTRPEGRSEGSFPRIGSAVSAWSRSLGRPPNSFKKRTTWPYSHTVSGRASSGNARPPNSWQSSKVALQSSETLQMLAIAIFCRNYLNFSLRQLGKWHPRRFAATRRPKPQTSIRSC